MGKCLPFFHSISLNFLSRITKIGRIFEAKQEVEGAVFARQEPFEISSWTQRIFWKNSRRKRRWRALRSRQKQLKAVKRLLILARHKEWLTDSDSSNSRINSAIKFRNHFKHVNRTKKIKQFLNLKKPLFPIPRLLYLEQIVGIDQVDVQLLTWKNHIKNWSSTKSPTNLSKSLKANKTKTILLHLWRKIIQLLQAVKKFFKSNIFAVRVLIQKIVGAERTWHVVNQTFSCHFMHCSWKKRFFYKLLFPLKL